MTPKELFYIEDALGQEKLMVTKCRDFSAKFQDKDLKAYVSQLATKHQKAYDKLFQLLKS